MGIKVIKEKKAWDYTFIDDTANLNGIREQEQQPKDKKRDMVEQNMRLRHDTKINKLKHRSKITGGHSMQGHSPVYE